VAAIRLERVTKVYPNGHVAARDVDLEVRDGEFLVLVGPSGCGKSTLLRIVAGLETATRGRVWIGDRDVTDVPPQERDVAMVFQSYALYPHKTVRENLAFGLRMRRTPKAEIERRVAEAARVLGLAELLDRTPRELSGGQRQRVALGRAIVRDPKAFLFDEPLSNLDAKLRVQTRAELARLHRRLGATMLYVTHDQEEAMTLGDRVAVLRDGVLQQVAPPLEVYRRPANLFVAGFVGSPAMNLLRGRIRPTDEGLAFEAPGVTVPVGSPNVRPGAEVWLGIRPPDVQVSAPGAGPVPARVDVVEPRGSECIVHLAVGRDAATLVRAVLPPDREVREDEPVSLAFPQDRLHLFDAETESRID
jgi:multiple sugar transport system ATP-binding protein